MSSQHSKSLPFIQGSLLALIAVQAAVSAFADEPASTPWENALQFEYSAAAKEFERMHKASPADSRVAIGYASTLLSRQPRTEGNIQKASQLLEHVATSAPDASPEHLAAFYLLARVEQDHLSPPQTESALRRYEQLLDRHPGSLVADQSAIHLAMAAFKDMNADNASAVIARIEALLLRVQNPEAARELRILLANLYWRELRDAPRALAHFVAARHVGGDIPMRLAEIDLAIGGIASEAGDVRLATEHYRAFLDRYPRDIRSSTVRNLIAALEKTPASPAAR